MTAETNIHFSPLDEQSAAFVSVPGSTETDARLYAHPSIAQPGTGEVPTVLIHGSVRVPGAHEDTPWTLECPEELNYEGIVFLQPGYGGIKRSSRGERHANAAAGRATLSYDPARISSHPLRNIRDSQALHTLTGEAILQEVSHSDNVRHFAPNARQLDFGRLLLSPHSMGGFPAVDLALKDPSRVDSIVFKASAGFGFPTLATLKEINTGDFAAEVRDYLHSGQIEPTLKNLYRILRYYLRKPSRTIGEARTCLTDDMRPKVMKLGELGVKMGFLGFERDPLIPTRHIGDSVSLLVDRYEIMPGAGHLGPQLYPVETSARVFAIHEAIHDLEAEAA